MAADGRFARVRAGPMRAVLDRFTSGAEKQADAMAKVMPGSVASKVAGTLPEKPFAHKPSRFVPKVPARICLYGKTRSGKTYFLAQMIMSPENPWDVVIWCAPEGSLRQPLIKKMRKHLNGDREKKGANRGSAVMAAARRGRAGPPKPKRFYTIEGDVRVGLNAENGELLQSLIDGADAKGLQTLVVFDDLMTSKSAVMTNLFISGRHRNVSVATLAQRVFTGDNAERTRRLNAEYHCVFDLGSVGQAEQLAMQLDRSTAKDVVEAYRQVMRRRTPGKYLMIDREAASDPDASQRLLAFRDSSLDRVFSHLADTEDDL